MITRCALASCQCRKASSLHLVVDFTIKIIYFDDISAKLFSVLKIEK